MEATTYRVVGFDFGLKTFLTDHTGKAYVSALHHLHAWRRLQVLQSRQHQQPPESRRTHCSDAHFKLAHELCDQYFVSILKQVAAKRNKALFRLTVSCQPLKPARIVVNATTSPCAIEPEM